MGCTIRWVCRPFVMLSNSASAVHTCKLRCRDGFYKVLQFVRRVGELCGRSGSVERVWCDGDGAEHGDGLAVFGSGQVGRFSECQDTAPMGPSVVSGASRFWSCRLTMGKVHSSTA
jgi:hypothetical protein